MANNDPELDLDSLTDAKLFQENKTWSKGYILRKKILSHINGTKVPSRRKVFSEIHTTADLKIWTTEVLGKTIPCARVHNPELLSKESDVWRALVNVERLEIEDPEGSFRTIPKHMTLEMTSLESFTLTWTKVKTLPPTLFQLPLKFLYLLRNQLKSVNGIEKAEQLTILDISNNQIESLPKLFGQLVNLTNLNVSNNELKELPDSIGALSCLKIFDCSCNKLKSLPGSICNMIGLESLDVCNNQLSSLPTGIGNLPCLGDLRARSNQLQSLPDDFGRLVELHSLILRKNRFVEVPQQLRTLPKLHNLNMRENSIRRMDISIGSLQTLILDSNELTSINNGILHCTNLQLLSLKSNRIDIVSNDIKCLRTLKSLYLCENNIIEVPESLSQLDYLKNLSFAKTKISRIPNRVVFMPSLTVLDLSECTELDRYLLIEYNKTGLEGVRNYLKAKEEPHDYEEPVVIDDPYTAPNTGKVVHMPGGLRRTIMVPDDTQPDPETSSNDNNALHSTYAEIQNPTGCTSIKTSNRKTLDVDSVFINADPTGIPRSDIGRKKIFEHLQDISRQSIYPDEDNSTDDDVFERKNISDKLNQHRNRPVSIEMQPQLGRQMVANFKTELQQRLAAGSGGRSPTSPKFRPSESSSNDLDVVEYATVNKNAKNFALTETSRPPNDGRDEPDLSASGSQDDGKETTGVTTVKPRSETLKKPTGESGRSFNQPPSTKPKPPTASKPPTLMSIDEQRTSFIK